MQEIYINLDDSGKLTKKELISVYGGLVFLSKKEKDKFITQYRGIVNEIKCKYCKKRCNKKCPEIKNTNIKNSDKRRIMNYLKKYYVVGLIIKNQEVYKHIIESKAAKGRFVDYSLRRMIKEVINNQIIKNNISSHKPLKVVINIDEQTTKSNGYYNLHDGLIEELKYGISNFNYACIYNPIFFNDLDIKISYQDSSKSYLVQAADLISGTIRRSVLNALINNENINNVLDNFINYKILLPWKKATIVA